MVERRHSIGVHSLLLCGPARPAAAVGPAGPSAGASPPIMMGRGGGGGVWRPGQDSELRGLGRDQLTVTRTFDSEWPGVGGGWGHLEVGPVLSGNRRFIFCGACGAHGKRFHLDPLGEDGALAAWLQHAHDKHAAPGPDRWAAMGR